MTFFFLVVIPFFALPDLLTLYLEMIESKRSRKYKNTYSNCPKFCREINAFLQTGGASAPRTPHFLRLW